MKYYKIKVLLVGGLFVFCLPCLAKVILKDIFIYRVNDQVFTLSDIKNRTSEFAVLSCLYQDSLLIRSFPLLTKVESSDLESIDMELKKVSDRVALIFQQAVLVSKLNQYVETHNVYISKKLKTAFYRASRKECNDIDIFKDPNSFTKTFKKMITSELFLRKRFLGEKKRSLKAEDSQKAILLIKDLLNIIEKQVDSELYWKK
jgi:hypothetical protein